jgi:hypothetical protein
LPQCAHDGKRNARQEPPSKLSPAGALGSEQKCSTNYAKSLTMTGADGPIRVSVILANRSGVNAGERFSHRPCCRRPSFCRITFRLLAGSGAGGRLVRCRIVLEPNRAVRMVGELHSRQPGVPIRPRQRSQMRRTHAPLSSPYRVLVPISVKLRLAHHQLVPDSLALARTRCRSIALGSFLSVWRRPGRASPGTGMTLINRYSGKAC